jgi:hypothetical protein
MTALDRFARNEAREDLFSFFGLPTSPSRLRRDKSPLQVKGMEGIGIGKGNRRWAMGKGE